LLFGVLTGIPKLVRAYAPAVRAPALAGIVAVTNLRKRARWGRRKQVLIEFKA
jgi:hypothetical protein